MNTKTKNLLLLLLGIVTGCALFLSLFFNFFYFSGAPEQIKINGQALVFNLEKIAPLLSENGFSMLDGKSIALMALYGENISTYHSLSWMETLLTISAYGAIAISLACITFSILAFFFQRKANLFLYLSFGCAIFAVTLILANGLVSTAYLNKSLQLLFKANYTSTDPTTQAEVQNALKQLSFKTSSFFPFIIVGVLTGAQLCVLLLVKTTDNAVQKQPVMVQNQAVMSQNQAYAPVKTGQTNNNSATSPVRIVLQPHRTDKQNNTPQSTIPAPVKNNAPQNATPNAPQNTTPTPTQSTTSFDIEREKLAIELLPKYKQMYEDGIITKEEWEKKKNELLWK